MGLEPMTFDTPVGWLPRNFPFREQAMPFLRDLENFRTVIEILHYNWKCFYCKKEIHHR